MFVINYYQGETLVAIEGSFETHGAAAAYLATRRHYLAFTPRILSMNKPRLSDSDSPSALSLGPEWRCDQPRVAASLPNAPMSG